MTTAEFADEQLAAHVAAAGAFDVHDVTAIREAIDARAATREPGPALHRVVDLDGPTCPARLYRPVDGPTPLVVYLHGGGCCVGSVVSFDRPLRRLAAAAGVSVLSLEYRLAPEDPFPAAVDDTVAALRWVATHPSALGPAPTSVAVAGDSSGGQLAALACLRLRAEAPDAAPDLQVLLYADTDMTHDHPSMTEKASGYGLSPETSRFFDDLWVPDRRMRSDPRVSPLHEPDLTGLPAALVVTAEHDILRDEGEAYAARLRAAGVEVTLRREPGMIHNFLQLDDVSPAARAAADRVAEDLARLLPGASPDGQGRS